MDYFSTIIETTLNSFDIPFCISVNVLTYIIIKALDDLNGDKAVSTWTKRAVTVFSVLVISLFYYLTGCDVKLVVNSAILAPVSWNWIIKPICDKLGVDYKKDDYED